MIAFAIILIGIGIFGLIKSLEFISPANKQLANFARNGEAGTLPGASGRARAMRAKGIVIMIASVASIIGGIAIIYFS